jgi:hypothetical protein
MAMDRNEMLKEFLESDELKKRSDLSLDELAAVTFSAESNNDLVDAIRTLVREFYGNRDNDQRIIKNVNLWISNRVKAKQN